MDRLACVNVVDLPLQILLRRHPEWRELPAAVINEDKPQGVLTAVNRIARAEHIQVGMRYAQALSLVPGLRAGVVSEVEVQEHLEAIITCLYRYSPHVECFEDASGVFFLDASGLKTLYPSLFDWALQIKQALDQELQFFAFIAVGFSRFATYAIARTSRQTGVFDTPQSEQVALKKVPLRGLDVDVKVLESLEQLGIYTVEQLIQLPEEGLRRRLGKGVWRLHCQATGKAQKPLRPYRIESAPQQTRFLDDAESNTTRLLFLIKQLVHPLVVELRQRQEKLVRLQLIFTLETKERLQEQLQPAAPTLDEVLLMELVRLRLESIDLPSGVQELEVSASGTRTELKQLHLFATHERRDMEAANRALARVRAEFGEQAVVSAKLRDAHLPEARFEWVPLRELHKASAHNVEKRSLIRRLLPRPGTLPARWLDYPESPQICAGPFIISGGWWVKEVQREYYFVETARKELLWVYYDCQRSKWFLQGMVE